MKIEWISTRGNKPRLPKKDEWVLLFWKQPIFQKKQYKIGKIKRMDGKSYYWYVIGTDGVPSDEVAWWAEIDAPKSPDLTKTEFYEYTTMTDSNFNFLEKFGKAPKVTQVGIRKVKKKEQPILRILAADYEEWSEKYGDSWRDELINLKEQVSQSKAELKRMQFEIQKEGSNDNNNG